MNRNLVKHIIFFITLALLTVAGEVVGQNDPQFVIKKGDHYLAHVNNALTNVDTFDPATCLWFSGPNVKNNYYFMDGSNRRYLKAPLEQGGTLSLSSSNPGTVVLNTTSDDYFFYAWDHGVARGIQRPIEQCQGENPALPNGLNPNGNQCWEVVWVSYENDTWKMSTAESYSIVLNAAALHHSVTVTPHEEVITQESGGINSISPDFSMEYNADPLASQELNYSVSNYSYSIIPAYTCYGFEAISVHETNNNNHINPNISIDIDEEFHYFDANGSALDAAPSAIPHDNNSETGRVWTISGDGAAYLSFSQNASQLTSSSANPTVYYLSQNTTNSHKQATITLVVTYEGGATQTRTVTVTAKTSCQNPEQASAPVVTFDGVTVSWHPTDTDDDYTVSWKKNDEAITTWSSASVHNATSYTIRDLEGNTEYVYKVKAECMDTEPSGPYPTFTTKPQNALILGSIYGGGRMADVTGTTEVVIVNCDSIGAVYGGNDIAGTVHGYVNGVEGAGGSTIKLGVDTGDATYASYGTTDANIGVRIGDVYGGGNGYYAYNGTTIEQASYNTTYDVANGDSIVTFTPLHPEGEAVWINETGSSKNWVCPTIPMANITVTNDCVKIDSLFGGAKNAILNDTTNDVNITVNGGTIYTVFGGNNFGGSLGYQSQENITVNNTTVKTTVSDYQAKRMGRDFGIGYLFGGGNKVQGQHIGITINGGQTDTIFGGGNAADIRSAQVTVNCALNKTYTQALYSYHESTIDSIDAAYKWEGKGYYNVRTLFGGNNRANMAGVPTLNLTSGGIGTVYGGGNAGDMLADATDNGNSGTLTINDNNVKYGTHVKTDSPNILIDYLYGGCQMSNVYYSTWVEIKNGHVGTVYGGCNISGDVGSTRVDRDQEPFVNGDPNPLYQKVYGAPYVVASGGTVYNNVFAGSNGLYHCKDAQGIHYIAGINYDPFGHSYVGMTVPTHNETYVIIKDNVLVKGNVYAGGNLACVGFQEAYEAFPELVGLSSVRMSGGTVDGNVFGGGNMASIYGSNEIQVSGGSIGVRLGGALYGGNDRLGKAGIISNRVLPPSYNTASDGYTSLNPGGELNKVKTYLGVTGSPTIHTVYGGGNGAYYDYNSGNYCDPSNLPIQTNIFVDINIEGGDDGGHIQNVYGGGNGVYADGFIKVFLNVQNCTGDTRNHVDTIYGGNNMGDMSVVPDIIMLHGNVHTVYGGCNSGAMAATGDKTKSFSVGGTTYDNIGSYVRLLSTYPGLPLVNNEPTYFAPDAKITGAVYGGCRMNGVTNNSLVLVEGGNHSGASFFAGSDISGDVAGISYMVMNGSYDSETSTYAGVVGEAYGGGNGNYDYSTGGDYEGMAPPYCKDSRVVMLNGQAANLYAGGYAGDCGITSLLVNGGLVSNKVFGGGNMAGVITSHNLTTTTVDNGVSTTTTTSITTAGTSTVTMNGGTVNAGVYGGSNAQGTIASDVLVNVTGGTIGASTSARANVHGGGYGHETHTSGNVTVNIGATTGGENPTYSGAATINGDIYGGSALGQVSATDSLTQVNFYGGTINGDVYGGGLGQQGTPAVYDPEDPTQIITPAVDPIAAEVSSDVEVNIHGGVFNAADGTPGGGSIFGCNNANGTPKGKVDVNIYATDHGNDFEHNLYPTAPDGGWTVESLATNALTQTYAIGAVFGGGNRAAYVPTSTEKKATVHVYNCDNTINDVYGGGNAADVGTDGGAAVNTFVIVDGGRINRVFGGGNGEVTAANIYGTATTTVKAGLINQIFGCGNMQGAITSTSLNINKTGDCADLEEVFGEVFGGANLAPFTGSLNTSIICGVGDIGSIYGGSNLATIDGNVTLNIAGGNFKEVYGGSKGQRVGDDPANPSVDQNALITGNVTLNLNGGTIVKAFGGSNRFGNIKGKITVNVLENSSCPLVLDTVFGSGNLTYYTPDQGENGVITSPEVNILHGTVRKAVFGGGMGSTAEVTANPKVTIGSPDSEHKAIVTGSVYGGGNAAPVMGNTLIIYDDSNALSVVDTIFGGGNEAGVSGTATVNMNHGKVIAGIFGGCNTQGVIGGAIEVNIADGTLGLEGIPMTQGIFGGGYGQQTATTNSVTVNIGDNNGHAPTIYADIYGGSALGKVHDENTLTHKNTINFAQGTLYGNLYGGGLGNDTIPAEVYGSVEVNIGKDKDNNTVNGSIIYGSVFGANNVNGSPKGDVTVNVYTAVVDSIFGGGNHADYVPRTDNINHPAINIIGGTINRKVVGGGNAANVGSSDGSNVITASPKITISGGTVCTTIEKAGIYGGCNTTGTVYGSIELNITGNAVIGSQEIVEAAKKPVNVHGGGYGQGTAVTGNIVVNYGDITAEQSLFPKLYGNLYGGSALGSVNTNWSDNTIVNVANGSIISITETVNPGQPNATTYYYSGNIFGGGLGRKADLANNISGIAAAVNGTVHVNIGDATTPPSSGLKGKATLIGCNVYGCNNQNGSPQDNVYVDVYQTAHVTGTNTVDDDDYAILRVFGGGNEANYAPLNGQVTLEKRTHVYIHGCDNTIKYVYGGGNAADAMGVESIIEGGRFNEVYGGGNGLLLPANIGEGSVGFIILGGHLNFLFEGSNKQGHIAGTPYVPILPQGYIDNCSSLTVDSYYFGDNEAEHIGDIVNTITCEQASQFNYKYVYAGSRWAVVYGDVKLTVQGGNIRYLFGGSKGYLEEHIPADVRMYPSVRVIDSVNNIHPGYYSADLRAHMVAHPELVGTGGNVELIINGGTIGEVIGGCDELGTVDGKITVIVDEIDGGSCPLFIGNLYGANNLSDCASVYTDPDDVSTPKVSIVKGTVGGTATFHYDVSNPQLSFAGNVYGGGNEGNVTSNPLVVVGDGTKGNTATPVTIKGDVFGGGNLGNVIGSTKVVVVPEQHKLTVTPPTSGHGTLSVAYTRGAALASDSLVGEDIDLRIIATPSTATADGGYLFTGWTVTGAGASVEDPSAANTLFTMGTDNATLSASFTQVPTKSLALATTPVGAGTFKVDGVAHNAGSTLYIPIGATVTVQALHLTGFIFKEWTVTGATPSSTTSSVTSFVMGDEAVTLTAVFDPVYTLTLVSDPTGTMTFKVNGANYTGPLSYRQGTMVTVQAIAASGYAFLRWEVDGSGSSVGNVNAATTSFTIGAANATLTAKSAATHTFAYTGENGTVTVTDILNQPVQSGAAIGAGATLHIKATPATGYHFTGWTVAGTGASVGDASGDETDFTMGTANATLTANFVPARTLTLTADGTGTGSFTVNEVPYTEPVLLPVGSTVTIGATHGSGSTFSGWTVVYPDGLELNNDNPNTFTLPEADTEIKGTFNHR